MVVVVCITDGNLELKEDRSEPDKFVLLLLLLLEGGVDEGCS